MALEGLLTSIPEVGCLNGVPVNIIKTLNTLTNTWSITAVYSTNPATGALVNVPLPVAGLVAGPCPTVLPPPDSIKVFVGVHELNAPSIVTFADLQAFSGASKLMSVTVKQMGGLSVLTADYGIMRMSAGEVWSWSAEDQNIMASAMSIENQSGTTRISFTYTL